MAHLLPLAVPTPSGSCLAQEQGDDAGLKQLERLEQTLAASRQRLAEQQAGLDTELAPQRRLAEELEELRALITGENAPQDPAEGPEAPGSSNTPAPAPTVTCSPGSGFTLRSGDSLLKVWAEAKLLGFSSNRFLFNPGQPLIVSPESGAPLACLTSRVAPAWACHNGGGGHQG